MMNTGWFEEYDCGCVSDTVKRKRDLIGYCGIHGGDRRGIFRQLAENIALQTQRLSPDMKSTRGDNEKTKTI